MESIEIITKLENWYIWFDTHFNKRFRENKEQKINKQKKKRLNEKTQDTYPDIQGPQKINEKGKMGLSLKHTLHV